MRIYEVGGCPRDEILGVNSKDIDFTVVLSESDLIMPVNGIEISPFNAMVYHLKNMGFKIFLETPEYLTVRAQFPRTGSFQSIYVSPTRHGLTADFVLARKEGEYTDGRRPDRVIPGTLEDDLARRDFTMNAIAKDPETGEYIDPHGGIASIKGGYIAAVGDAQSRLDEDALRAVRAIRFAVTKGFHIRDDVRKAMESDSVIHSIINKISDERIASEVEKMVRFDTVASIEMFNRFPVLTRAMFSGRVSLDATMKQRKP